MINTYNFLSKRLKSGGTYVMEDVDMNYPTRVQKIMDELSDFSPKLIDLRSIKGRYDDAMIIFEKL